MCTWRPTACFFKSNLIGPQPCPFVYVLSVTVCVQRWPRWLAAMGTVLLREHKIFIIWIFAGRSGWTLVEKVLEDMVGPKSHPGGPRTCSVIRSRRQGERTKDPPAVLEVLQACTPFYRQTLLSKQVVNLNPTPLCVRRSLERVNVEPENWLGFEGRIGTLDHPVEECENLGADSRVSKCFPLDTEWWLLSRDDFMKWVQRLTDLWAAPVYLNSWGS